ncbi:DUF4352 domain-containing protein [Streptomyces carpaticus]|uniref:DUF4352 domain-containing protein n=1 Tax=Streptomyces TaxID=1883 RepID=UPI002176DB9B|nr:DUF4352 domain-containing protein [Streptomyces ginkgonis]UWM52040.1 DUF4352 domain-containing protein [Streptomyces carpaticus]
MNVRLRRAAIAVAAGLTLSVTGCSSSGGDSDRPPLSQRDAPAEDDAEPVGDDSRDDASAGPDTQAPGDLAPGESYTWPGGLSLTIDALTEVDTAGLDEWSQPEGDTLFAVTISLTNDGDRPADLDSVSFDFQGATVGGEVYFEYHDDDEELTGRLAPGQSVTKRISRSMDTEAYGREVVITAYYWGDEGTDFLGDDPEWVATIE